ncbi:D-alanyl-D-alanine carboxypeptidase [Prosthecochloris sp. N3]|uniref:D-alanyl-D-alanine carboxypeptidase n=2 Tax=Prosthecochloris ethylica TaxID=2743976 RepID=A0ABR9XNZ4_9CHLB|nr:D-alanyl-D-alanine carboxypeptidase [Prosthecochloris ethylica]MBF0585817.1 D-alanyl-D-alanine carboxypeptidase [Prosthecochloris ethylica]MBF0635727.1 D-alanyl-D-alanine carboxypeptidase [Prosthecochloris ethylica]NUK47025.1 D-alanyl-D-alanine carboxypeptidase [Prosthecochloris ethylica]
MMMNTKRAFDRRLCGLVLVICSLFAVPASAAHQQREWNILRVGELELSSCVLKDIGRSDILLARNMEQSLQPASLTKILTCMIAIESGHLGERVVIPGAATQVEPSRLGLKAGDEVRLIDLVKAAMVKSANDAAFAIAIHLGGSIEGFARIMNSKARSIGMLNSRFTNPAGYDTDAYAGHRSTASDLLLLTEYAVRNDMFNAIARLDRVEITEQRSGTVYAFRTSNKLLRTYPYAVGIKTGYTMKAGKCLIARATRNGRDLVLVMLDVHANRWALAEMLFDKAFALPSPGAVPYEAEARGRERSSFILKGAGVL